jgi:hypothetical protein
VEGTFWFVTGERRRKGRNLAGDPRYAMSVSTDEFDPYRLTAHNATAVVTIGPGDATRWHF